MRKAIALLLLSLLLLSVAGCSGKLRIAILGDDGSALETYTNEHLEISFSVDAGYVEMSVFTKAQNITLFWPKDSLTLPDGSKATLAYLRGLYFNDFVYSRVLPLYEWEGGSSIEPKGPVTLRNKRSTKLFVDTSPTALKNISPQLAMKDFNVSLSNFYKGYRIAIVKDPNDFVAPMRASASSKDFYFMESFMNKLKSGQTITWSFAYRIESTGEMFEKTITVLVMNK